jgi:hypothetical protein
VEPERKREIKKSVSSPPHRWKRESALRLGRHRCGLFSPLPLRTFLFFPPTPTGSPKLTRLVKNNNKTPNKTKQKNSGASSVSARPTPVAPRARLLASRSSSSLARRAPLLLVVRAEDEKKEGGGDFYNDERPVSFAFDFESLLSTHMRVKQERETLLAIAHLLFLLPIKNNEQLPPRSEMSDEYKKKLRQEYLSLGGSPNTAMGSNYFLWIGVVIGTLAVLSWLTGAI